MIAIARKRAPFEIGRFAKCPLNRFASEKAMVTRPMLVPVFEQRVNIAGARRSSPKPMIVNGINRYGNVGLRICVDV